MCSGCVQTENFFVPNLKRDFWLHVKMDFHSGIFTSLRTHVIVTLVDTKIGKLKCEHKVKGDCKHFFIPEIKLLARGSKNCGREIYISVVRALPHAVLDLKIVYKEGVGAKCHNLFNFMCLLSLHFRLLSSSTEHAAYAKVFPNAAHS